MQNTTESAVICAQQPVSVTSSDVTKIHTFIYITQSATTFPPTKKISVSVSPPPHPLPIWSPAQTSAAQLTLTDRINHAYLSVIVFICLWIFEKYRWMGGYLRDLGWGWGEVGWSKSGYPEPPLHTHTHTQQPANVCACGGEGAWGEGVCVGGGGGGDWMADWAV